MTETRRPLSAENVRRAGIGFLPDRTVARALGVTRQAIAVWRKKLGLPPPPNLRIQAYEKYIAKNPQATYPEVCAALKCSRATVLAWARQTKMFPAEKPYKKESRWTDAEVIDALGKSRSMREAAEMLGTHEVHLYYMVRTRGLREVVRIPDGRKR